MTSEQLGECLEYSHPRESINKLVSRNEYLRNKEFNCEVKMTSESGAKSTRIFTEDGIYEVTMLAKTEKAKEFRAWVRGCVKKFRSCLILTALVCFTAKTPHRLNIFAKMVKHSVHGS